MWKKALLSVVVTALFFAGLELALLVLGVQPHWYDADPYVGFSSWAPLFVEQRQADGTVMMVRAANKTRLFNQQQFPKQKGPSAYRVFCVGGSTTYGRPYDDTTSFCGVLGELLAAAQPSREWQVVNAGGISYASYRVAMLMEELVRYEPDLFVVYSGHNEFLERRTYGAIIDTPPAVRGMGAVASRTRTFAAVKRAVDLLRRDRADTGETTVLDADVTTLLDDAVGPSAYTRDDELEERALQHFRFNLARMVDIASSVGAATVLVVPASNLRDCTPFKSDNGPDLGDAELVQWRAAVSRAETARAAGDLAAALAEVEAARAIDNRHAALNFLAGRLYDELGRHTEARRAYEQARDEDVCPLRALSAIQHIVTEIAADRGVPVVDFPSLVDSRSADGIPGAEYFFDHVHPTLEGHRLLAEAVFEVMQEQEVVEAIPSWDRAAADRVVARIGGSVDQEEHGIALMNLSKVLGWAGKLEEADRLARQAAAMAPDSARVHYQAGLTATLRGRVDDAILSYRKAIEIEPTAALPHGNLGVALESKGQLQDALPHYRRALELGSERDRARNLRNLHRALVHLGYRAFTQGRPDVSARFLAEADRLDPGNPDTLDKLAVALLALNRVDDAIERFQAATALAPEDAGVRNRLAVALSLAGRLDEASEQYLQAVAIDPGIADTRDSLVNFLARQGRTADARRIEEAAGRPGE